MTADRIFRQLAPVLDEIDGRITMATHSASPALHMALLLLAPPHAYRQPAACGQTLSLPGAS